MYIISILSPVRYDPPAHIIIQIVAAHNRASARQGLSALILDGIYAENRAVVGVQGFRMFNRNGILWGEGNSRTGLMHQYHFFGGKRHQVA